MEKKIGELEEQLESSCISTSKATRFKDFLISGISEKVGDIYFKIGSFEKAASLYKKVKTREGLKKFIFADHLDKSEYCDYDRGAAFRGIVDYFEKVGDTDGLNRIGCLALEAEYLKPAGKAYEELEKEEGLIRVADAAFERAVEFNRDAGKGPSSLYCYYETENGDISREWFGFARDIYEKANKIAISKGADEYDALRELESTFSEMRDVFESTYCVPIIKN